MLKSDAGNELVAAAQSLRNYEPFFTTKVSEMILSGFLRSGGCMNRHAARERTV